MKTKTLIWTIVIIALVLIVISYFVGQANLKKTAAAIATAPEPNTRIVGHVVNSLSSRWIQVPNQGNGCPQGAVSGQNLGMSPTSTNPDVYACYVSVPNVS